jgi:hypothetical protein
MKVFIITANKDVNGYTSDEYYIAAVTIADALSYFNKEFANLHIISIKEIIEKLYI